MSGFLSFICLHASYRYFDFVKSKSEAFEKFPSSMTLVKHMYASNFLCPSSLREPFCNMEDVIFKTECVTPRVESENV